jgi:hypothetical protein
MTAQGEDNLATATLAELRAELRELVALAGAAEKPKPDYALPAKHGMAPGHEWVIDYRAHDLYDQTRLWQVLVRDADDVADCVYIHTPDSMIGDYVCAPTLEARRLAMAILAACDRAEELSAGVTHLDARRSRRKSVGDQMT